jgi:putative hydrolase of the HAD superfamily
MGVVSNWPATLESSLMRAGLREYFSVVVASGVVGYAKPRPEIFLLATDQLGVHPERTLYVGDSMSHDVAGANGAGLHTVLVDRSGAHVAHEPRVTSLSELLEHLNAA